MKNKQPTSLSKVLLWIAIAGGGLYSMSWGASGFAFYWACAIFFLLMLTKTKQIMKWQRDEELRYRQNNPSKRDLAEMNEYDVSEDLK